MILISPKINRNQKLAHFERYVVLSVPFGLGMLAGYLGQKNKKVRIIDECVTPLTDGLLDEYLRGVEPPYIFGISCLTANISRAYEISKTLKERYPNSKVILGGIHATVLPEECLNTGYVDIVVRREGEETLNALYELIKKRADYSSVPGISFIDVGAGIVHNQDAPVMKDLNMLPAFPYHFFEENLHRYNLGFIMSSRGCPYDCIFCSQRSISGRLYRYMEPEKVIEQIDFLVNRYKQRFIDFWDDNFVVNKKWTKRVCELMLENKFHKKAKFGCYTRGDAVNEEMLSCLKEAGFTTIGFGMETASERLMKLINKGETVEANIKGVKLAKKFGFRVAATFIMGLPTETRDERLAAYRLAKELNIDYARFNNACPYPGTKLYEIAKSENRLNVGKNWEHLNSVGALVESSVLPYVPLSCNEDELKKDILKANYSFWLRPKSILLLLSGKNSTWFPLPQKWYLNLKEWSDLIRFSFVILNKLFMRTFKTIGLMLGSDNCKKGI
jgi:radical SAM superfamily enzyme YgiQ (UPF0313 family)